LLYLPSAFDPGQPFRFSVELMVETVTPHDPLDSGAAILGSFTPPFGNASERAQMVYLDSAAVGWADDAKSAAFAVTDGQYHTYGFAVDANHEATLSIDGVFALTRDAFSSNGTLAIGDQTNDKNVDGVMRIRSVTLLCP